MFVPHTRRLIAVGDDTAAHAAQMMRWAEVGGGPNSMPACLLLAGGLRMLHARDNHPRALTPAQAVAGPPAAALAAAASNGHAAATAHRLALVRLEAEARGGEPCFNETFYASANPDLQTLLDRYEGGLYKHYEQFGALEGRPHRRACTRPARAPGGRPL